MGKRNGNGDPQVAQEAATIEQAHKDFSDAEARGDDDGMGQAAQTATDAMQEAIDNGNADALADKLSADGDDESAEAVSESALVSALGDDDSDGDDADTDDIL